MKSEIFPIITDLSSFKKMIGDKEEIRFMKQPNGTTVVLTTPCIAGDFVEVEYFTSVSVAPSGYSGLYDLTPLNSCESNCFRYSKK